MVIVIIMMLFILIYFLHPNSKTNWYSCTNYTRVSFYPTLSMGSQGLNYTDSLRGSAAVEAGKSHCCCSCHRRLSCLARHGAGWGHSFLMGALTRVLSPPKLHHILNVARSSSWVKNGCVSKTIVILSIKVRAGGKYLVSRVSIYIKSGVATFMDMTCLLSRGVAKADLHY